MPLTDNGFEHWDWDQMWADTAQRYKDHNGQDADISPGSPGGKIIALWTDLRMEEQDHEEDVYDSAFDSTSTGVSLDRRGSNVGVQRNLAQPAEVTLKITGTPGYLIAEETEFMTENGDSFLTAEDVQIGDDGTCTVKANSAEDAAYTNVDADTIVAQANPVDEITAVTNPAAAVGGADLETDFDYRQRIHVNDKSKEGPTVPGLQAAVINVPSVTGVEIQQNLTDKVDANGNPPTTLHFYVSGGKPEDVAWAIADNIAAGAITVGDQVFHETVGGSDVEVHFDNAQSIVLYFKITLTQGTGYDEDAVKQAVADFLADFDMGNTIILNKLYTYLYDLAGVDEVTDIQASKDGKTYSADNVTLEKYQIAKTSDDAIEVTANA